MAIAILIIPNFSWAAPKPFIVIDVADGAVIAANREFDRWYPASLTKLMTAYATMQAISKGEIAPGSPVRISKRANKMPASRMGYKVGTKLRVDTALKILIVKSANDVAIALAETVAGSVEEFADLMNKQAKSLGMQNSHFTNPNGLHSKSQYTSARDLAILSRRLLLDFPQYANWFAIAAIKTSVKTHYSYNLLLERFTGANGMKTGFVCASGYNMVASAKRNNRQLIAVVLGTGSQVERAKLAAKLLSQAFQKQQFSIGNLLSPSPTLTAAPKNMRPILCTQEARKVRYEPGAGLAVVKSQYLTKRKKQRNAVLIKTGNITAKPGIYTPLFANISISRIPIPTLRPSYSSPLPFDNMKQVKNSLRGAIPIPVLRP